MFKSANVGPVDRILRLVVGAVLILLPYLTAWGLWADPIWRWGVPLVGVVMILTALVRFCPAYTLLGLNTCPRT